MIRNKRFSFNDLANDVETLSLIDQRNIKGGLLPIYEYGIDPQENTYYREAGITTWIQEATLNTVEIHGTSSGSGGSGTGTTALYGLAIIATISSDGATAALFPSLGGGLAFREA